MKIIFPILLFCCTTAFVSAQSWQDKKVPASQTSTPFEASSFRHADLPWIRTLASPQKRHTLTNSQVNKSVFRAVQKSDPARVVWSESQDRAGRSQPQTREALLSHLSQTLPDLNHQTDLVTQEITSDDLGMKHHFLEQYFQGLPVFGAQLTLHESTEGFVRMNGRLFNVAAHVPEGKIDRKDAKLIVKDDLRSRTVLMDSKSLAMKLLQQSDEQREILYFDDSHRLHRAWQIKFIPNVYENWEYIVDASSGEILTKWNNVCRIHDHSNRTESIASEQPPALGSSFDLNGVNQEVRCFDDNGTFFLLDASREMFKSLGTADLAPQGVILTYDTKSLPIDEKTGFFPNELISSGDANNWDAKAVSAHVNAGIAYEYFRQLLQRNSINGNGGSIYSFINVADPEEGGDFDQAFWNEKIIFYGNGKDVFRRPLQAALDVAAHEMSHGVIQNSANLIYQGESGAINESIADFFGVATEARVTGTLDWKVGNGVVNTSIYRTGALRDLSNPNNGGTSLNTPGYQPQFYSDRFTGREDNEGVHINSGIVNHALYLLTESVGLVKAEQIIYRSLTVYLTRSSNFRDLRNGMVASATDLYGTAAEVQAVNEAFDFVEIFEGSGSEAPMEAEANTGSDLILATSTLLDQTDLYQLTDQQLVEIQSALIDEEIINPPSVTDDGSVILYVTEANEIKFISIDYNTGVFEGDVVSTQAIWRNAVISRDGSKIAALTTENDNMVWVFDLVAGTSKQFELFNPTFTEGVSTGNVEFADAMDFDFSGELLMYDASNLITSTTSEEFSYWDIGFLEVFDNEAETFADGDIFKLVTGLPDNVSIGNPVFSKNSPNIIALDYIEVVNDGVSSTTEYSILGVNIETGESELIHEISEQGGTLGYPTFSRSDQTILFNAMSEDNLGQPISVVKAAFLADNKIGAAANSEPVTVLFNHRWPVWYSNGERMLTGVFSTTSPELDFEFYPNPVVDQAYIKVDVSSHSAMHLRITDLLGRTVLTQRWPVQSGSLNLSIEGIGEIGAGVYFGAFQVGKDLVGFKFVVGR